MRIIRVVYSNKTKFILDIVEKFKARYIVETYNLDKRKEIKTAKTIQENMGTKNVPLISIEDENMEIVEGIYSETSPDWQTELIKKLIKYDDCIF